MKFHVVTGLPRSGSTLLCNVLNQNPRFYASSTSFLLPIVNSIIASWSNSIEIKNLLDKEKIKTELRMHSSLRAFTDAWCRVEKGEIYFDKSRGWTLSHLLLRKIYPDAKFLVMVRDIRNVFASIEKQYVKNPMLEEAISPVGKTVYHRADHYFSPENLIGAPLRGIEDILSRKANKNVLFVIYEQFSNEPKIVMDKIYKFIGEDYFDHNFDNVVNTSIDPDAYYLYKYPHKGEGKILPCDIDEWKMYITDELAETIMDKFSVYNNFFGYK